MIDPSVQVAIVSVLGTLIVTFGPKVARNLNERARQLGEVHEQVKNTHTTNFREDLDQVRDLVIAGFKKVDARIDGIHDEIRQERAERFAADQARSDK